MRFAARHDVAARGLQPTFSLPAGFPLRARATENLNSVISVSIEGQVVRPEMWICPDGKRKTGRNGRNLLVMLFFDCAYKS